MSSMILLPFLQIKHQQTDHSGGTINIKMKPSRNLSLSNEASYFSYSLDGESQNHSKNTSKNSPLDLKKLDLSKNPASSTSSLQLLILLLNRSLKFSLEEILGLFSNNSKYLAHLIVKGINDKFQGLRLFFELVHSNINILLRLFKENQNDGLACLYALKPGFISKDQKCASLTIELFQYFGGQIYKWFASKESKSGQTLLLGLRRHENLSQKFVKLFFSIIKGKEVEYLSTNFIACAANEIQLLQNISKLIQHFPSNQDSLVQKLENNGVFEKWFEVGEKLYESEAMDDKLIFIDFIGDFMLYLPEIIEKNASVTNLLRRNWQNLRMAQFVPLINQILINLQKLARKSYPTSRKLLKIIVDIFNQIISIEQKRQFIIQGVLSVLTQFPRIQSEIFITNYPPNYLVSTSDFMLFLEAVDKSDDYIGLIKIADFLKDLFFYDTLNNHSLSGPIIQAAKKIVLEDYNNVKGFCYNLLKTILSNYVILLIKAKNFLKTEQNQQNLNSPKKKNSEKQLSIAKSQITFLNKKIDLTITFAQKIIDIILSSYNSQQYIQTLKSYFFVANSEIKKNNFGMGTKRIINLLQKKLKVTKQQETMFEEQYQNQSLKPTLKLSESLLNGRPRQSFGIISSLSRIQVPDRSVKQIEAIIAKRKRDEQIKAEEEAKRKKQQEMKKIIYKKELQKMKLIKGGFGEGEAQLKQEGFWARFIKQTEEMKVYLGSQIEDSHLQAGEIIMKRYSKLFKYLFTNYSNTMHSSRTSNFTQNLQKKERLSHVEIIKFLKDYSLIFATNLQQVQTLIKDINIKIYQRRELLNEVDFQGFQQFIKQFCLCVWNRNLWRLGSKSNDLKFDHLTLPELLMNLIIYLKNAFKTKGQNMNLFDVDQVELKSSSPQIQELNEKLEINPNHILPEGFKKITDKKIEMKSFIKNNLNFPQNYAVIMEVLDQLLFDGLGIHIIEPYTQKVVKYTAKSLHQINVRDRDPLKIKARVLSTIIDRKSSIHSLSGSLLTKFQFSKGIRKGMILLKPQEKIIGQQVAYKLQQILNKVSEENEGENSPNKNKKINQFYQPEAKRSFSIQKLQSSQNNYQPLNSKLQIIQKTESYMLSRKQRKLQQQRKSEEKVQKKLKIKKQQDEKYFIELKLKLQEKKQSQAIQFTKLRAAQQRQRQKKKQKKQRIQEFTSKQVEKYKNKFQEIIEKKRKLEEELEIKIQDEQEKMRRIKQKIENQSKIITQIRKETTQKIMDILYGEGFKAMTKQYEVPLRAIFDYMLKYNANPLSKKKISPGQIDAEMWSKFNKVFQLSPLIVAPKDVVSIFKIVTKQKKVQKQYSAGLNYEEFLHCLLRQCIKQKTIFGKIAERIKDQKPNIEMKTKKSKSVNKKIQTKNQFQEEQETNIKKLLKEPDIKEDIIDHYGDVSKFSLESFKGLIFYLKMPFTKKGQQTRIKELIQIEKGQQTQHIPNVQKLKEKLKAEYKLQKNQKKDTINLQDEKPTEKSQIKTTKLQTKSDAKEKQQNKTPDLTKSIKQKK